MCFRLAIRKSNIIGLDAGGAQCRLSVTLLCPTLRIVPRKQSSRLGSCESSWTAYCRFAEILRELPDLTIAIRCLRLPVLFTFTPHSMQALRVQACKVVGSQVTFSVPARCVGR